MFRKDTVEVIDANSPDYHPNSLAFWHQYDLQAIHLFLRNTVIGVLHEPSLPNTPDIKGCLTALLIRLHSYKSLYHDVNTAIEQMQRPHREPRFNEECEQFLQLIASTTFHLNKLNAASKVAGVLGNEYTLIDRVGYNHNRIRFNLMAAIAYREIDKDLACHHYMQALEMSQFAHVKSDTAAEVLDAIQFLFANKPEIHKDNNFWGMVARINVPTLTEASFSKEVNDKAKLAIATLAPVAPKFLGFISEDVKQNYVMGSR